MTDATDATDAAATSDDELSPLEQEGEIAADYLEGLLDIADLDGDIDMDVEGGRASVSVVGADLGQLVGADGEVLEALQELTRLAVQTQTGERSRLMLDVGGHRARRRAELVQIAQRAVGEAQSSGRRVALAPMTAFERKVVHDAVAAAGLRSESEGEDPQRHVVVLTGPATSSTAGATAGGTASAGTASAGTASAGTASGGTASGGTASAGTGTDVPALADAGAVTGSEGVAGSGSEPGTDSGSDSGSAADAGPQSHVEPLAESRG